MPGQGAKSVQSQKQSHQNDVSVFIVDFEQISLCSDISIVDLNKKMPVETGIEMIFK